jgi:hypothetical protein
MMMCILYMYDYYLYNFFVEIIDNKKLEKSDGADDVYILHVKRYAISNCSELRR